ncbi:alcohol dehydrogenase catalytic domain-containing protein [Streptomyces flavofungini]|uniref:Alcohol dehydrogenase catalytic domain-containing protein n=1 Tax=Streptomyces flavofungini TaxID=68200 RepID=A0ABS0X7L9_9ACTN|nr:alcohol dehydrogenase catalytic domain-containing protein [Streptomyces flavofungini]
MRLTTGCTTTDPPTRTTRTPGHEGADACSVRAAPGSTGQHRAAPGGAWRRGPSGPGAALPSGATPFKGPFAPGHECVARIVEPGPDCTAPTTGDLVVVPWHISCGTCTRCVLGRPSPCERTPRYAMFGLPLGGNWGGMFTERFTVPWAQANVQRLPDGVSPSAAAAASDSLTDACDAVRHGLQPHPAQDIAVLGGLTHGRCACACAASLGAAGVMYVDRDGRRRSIAEGFGATTVDNARELGQRRFPVTTDAAGDPRSLAAALKAAAPGGHCHSIGICFQPAPLPLMTMYMDAITFTTGRPDTPHLADVLHLLQTHSVGPLAAYSHPITFDDLPEALPELPAKPRVLLD